MCVCLPQCLSQSVSMPVRPSVKISVSVSLCVPLPPPPPPSLSVSPRLYTYIMTNLQTRKRQHVLQGRNDTIPRKNITLSRFIYRRITLARFIISRTITLSRCIKLSRYGNVTDSTNHRRGPKLLTSDCRVSHCSINSKTLSARFLGFFAG